MKQSHNKTSKAFDKMCKDISSMLDEDAVYDNKKKKLETLLAAAEAKDTDLSQEVDNPVNDVLAGGENNNFELVDKQEETPVENESADEVPEKTHEPMTLDQAIEYCRETAEKLGCSDCANEHTQLGDWLEELKEYRMATGAGDGNEESEDEENSNGSICMTIPLFLRLLEYAREDAESDMDLHYAVENILEMSSDPGILGMDDYAEIIDIYDEDDEDDDEDDEHVDEAKKKKKYKKRKSSYLGRWSKYFPRSPWIVPCGFLPPPPKPPQPPSPPKPDDDNNVEDVTPPVDSGEVSGSDIVDGGGDAGAAPVGDAGGAAPIGESKVLDELNNIDEETLRKFIVTEFGPKISSSKDVADGKDKQTDAVELKQIASLSDISKLDTSSGESSCMLFVKFNVKDAVWAVTMIFDAKEHKFSKPEFLNPEYQIFQVNDKAEGAAAVFFKAFPELYEVKTF